MKEFLQLMRRFVSPYKKYIGWAIVLNVLSAVFNVFSFTLLIPILNILFKTGSGEKVYHFMEWGSDDLKDVAINNFYWFITEQINTHSEAWALMILRKISVAGPSGKAYVLSFCSGKAWAYKRSASASMNG